jgi:SLT domain-containing protein
MAGRIGGFMADAFTVDAGAMTRGLAGWINAHTLFGDMVVAGPVRFRLPALAAGGHVRVAGMALVGEEGPEVVTTTASFPTPAVQPVPQPRVQALRERYARPHTTVAEARKST